MRLSYRVPVVLATITLYLLYRMTHPSTHEDTSSDEPHGIDWSRFAYSLYATKTEYLCNAVMLADSLSRHGARAQKVLLYDRDWVVTPNTYEGRLLVKAMDEYDVYLLPVEVVALGGPSAWRESFTKLRAFNMTGFKRVLSLDSDATVLKRMDELFLLPSAPVAAPRAYWLEKPQLSSQLILLEPSKESYERIVALEKNLEADNFDMEILNQLFADEAMIIPSRPYDLVTGEFRKADHARYLGGEDEEWNAEAVLHEVKYLHFSDWPVPKPWQYNAVEEVQEVSRNCSYGSAPSCADLKVWASAYGDFWARKARVCDALG